MNNNKSFNGWSLAVILLTLVIVAGGIIIFIDIQNTPGIEITLNQPSVLQGKIYVSGEVNNPVLYPVFAGDTFNDIIKAAGGIKDGADLSNIGLSVAHLKMGQSRRR